VALAVEETLAWIPELSTETRTEHTVGAAEAGVSNAEELPRRTNTARAKRIDRTGTVSILCRGQYL